MKSVTSGLQAGASETHGKAWEGNLGSQLGRWASLPVGNPKKTERSREAEAIWQEVCQRRVPNLLVDGSLNPRLGNSDLQKWAAALGEAWAGGASSPSANCSAPFFCYSRFFCLGSLHLIFISPILLIFASPMAQFWAHSTNPINLRWIGLPRQRNGTYIRSKERGKNRWGLEELTRASWGTGISSGPFRKDVRTGKETGKGI